MSSNCGFVHLHLHSEYSLLDGGNRIDPLLQRVRALGMDAVALTDHGNLFGAIELYTKAKAAGVKPILGIEAYVAPGDRREKVQTGLADGGYHLVLLAENDTGWRNLLTLSSDSFINGFYYRPRMDKTTLTQFSEGLIAINGHLGSSIAHHLLLYEQSGRADHYENAVEEARWHAETFGSNSRGEPCFFIELQKNEIDAQARINPHLMRLARELNLPLVCDNDAHFLTADDYDAHDTLCCISMQKQKAETDRIRYPRVLYVKSPDEMAEMFGDVPEALENTLRIAERCNVEIDFSASHTPVVRIVYDPDASSSEEEDARRVPWSERRQSRRPRGRDGSEGREQSIDAPGSSRPSLRLTSSDFVPTTPPGASDSRHGASWQARRFVEEFRCEHPTGSTEWYKSFCSQFRLEPFNGQEAPESHQEVQGRCDAALRALAEAGAIWRYGERGLTPQIRDRLDRELTILADKRISAYFLIVWDFVNWARQRGIPANARGSGVGTMIGYVLGLSNACPVRYGLLFERFTDPDRSEYPDIDIDICQNGRADVINYVRRKYGHVAQIITFGRLKARQAIKDVARVMGLSATEGQRLSNLVPSELNITIDEALNREPDLRQNYDHDATVKRVIDHARALENHARHAGVHAAGVVIATQPLDTIVPLCRATGGEEIVTQWDGPTCEKVGLLKMDFLGLRTLSTIERAKSLIRQTLSDDAIRKAVADRAAPFEPLDLDRIPMDDQNVFDLFRRGDTVGIFQFESSGMRQLLVEMQPDRLEDLIAANALYRPGPMELIPKYNSRKHGREPVPSIHPIVDQYTAETYGIMVYQEQVMQIVHGLGDISLRAAYSLIKAISKKKSSVIDAERPRFIHGAKAKGLSERQANELFDLILKFAGYGFNKSHSTGYAIIAYQTAYLKTYFPNQYMAALLTYESQARKIEDWAPYLEDCRRAMFPDHSPDHHHVGVEVHPPDINLSDADFTVAYTDDEPRDNLHGHIRFGLSAIKGAGNAAIRAMISERSENGPFTSFFDFCERVDLRSVNKATIESLVKCGAFDSIHGSENRASLAASIEDAMRAGQAAAADRRAGQATFFESFASAQPERSDRPAQLRPTTPWTRLQAMQFEKETLGFHVSGHPLDLYQETLDAFCTHRIGDLADLPEETPVLLGAVVTGVRTRVTQSGPRAGSKWAWVTLQDRTGSVDAAVFSDAYAKYAGLIQADGALIIAGRVDRKRSEPNVIVEKIVSAEAAPQHMTTCIEVELKPGAVNDEAEQRLQQLREILFDAAVMGNGDRAVQSARVLLNLRVDRTCVTLQPGMLRVEPSANLVSRLRSLLGENGVRLHGGPAGMYVSQRSGNGNGNGFRKRNGAGGSSASSDDPCASIDRY